MFGCDQGEGLFTLICLLLLVFLLVFLLVLAVGGQAQIVVWGGWVTSVYIKG